MSRIHDASKPAAVTDAVVVEQAVTDTDEAAAVGMHGSPTILIDGVPSVTDLIAALRSA